jgi:hypothetical protein
MFGILHIAYLDLKCEALGRVRHVLDLTCEALGRVRHVWDLTRDAM